MTYEEAEKLMKWNYDWDWEKFRREAAKDILCSMIQAGVDDAWRNVVPAAIEGAEELIAKLKEK